MKIGDLFYQLLIEDGKLIAQAKASGVKAGTAAGDAAGATMGQRMSATLKTTLGVGAKVAATALAGGLAIAARGAAELENISADFQAQTGASADEAEATAKVINRVAGSERQSLQSVSEVAIRVKRDLGANGVELARLTGEYTKFGRVTKQDAAGAVADFDDILDAWGLTASDSVGIMDKLLVSQQRFGGSITDNQKALAALAPSLKAANLNIDDGIGLLNLFQASGVDSAVAVTGMTKALTKVKSPAELKALIADIIATEDPFLRAQKASDLFGAKAGAKLANALKPGAKALDEYQVSVEDAAGATDKAADIIDNTFTGRVQKAISEATAGLREFGAGFGPAVTGLASLSTLAGAAGGGKLVTGILGPIGGLGKKLAVKLAAAIGIGFASSAVSGAAEAGGDVIGNMTAKQIQKRLAGKAATDLLAKGLSDGLIGVESSSALKSSTDRLGKFMGSTLGKALSVAFAAVAVVELVKTYNDVADGIKQQTADLAKQTGEFAETATLEALVNARKGVAEQLKAMGRDPIAEALGLSARKGVEDSLAQLDAAIARHGPQTGKAVDDLIKPIAAIPDKIDNAFDATDVERNLKTSIVDPMDEGTRDVTNAAAGIVKPIAAIPDEIERVNPGAATSKVVGAITRALGVGVGPISEATRLMLGGVAEQVRHASYVAALAAAKTPGEIAAAISSRRGEVDAAMDNLTSVIKNNKGTERAKVLGYLIGSELAKALKSKDPLISRTAEQTQQLLLSRLKEVIPASGQVGKAAIDQVNAGIRSKNPAVREQAKAIKAIILANIKANTKPAGQAAGQGVATGLTSKTGAVTKAADNLGARAARALKDGFGNPILTANLVISADPRFKGYTRGLSEGGPVKKGVPIIVGEKRAEVFVPKTDGMILPSVPASRPGGPRDASPASTPLAAKFVEVITRSVSNIARDVVSSVSDTTVVLRELVERISAQPLAPPPAPPMPMAGGVKWELRPQTFAQGGVVQGPPGQPVGIIAHAGEEVVTAKDRRKPGPISTAVVHALTRSVSNIARSVSDTTVILRGIVEKVVSERTIIPAAVRPVAAGPTITARKPGVPLGVVPPAGVEPAAAGFRDQRGAEPRRQGQASSPPTMQPLASRAIAQAVQVRVKSMREAMPGPWMPLEARAGGGPVMAGVPYLVNENTQRSEIFVPRVRGDIHPDVASVPATSAEAAGGPTINLATYGLPMRAETPSEVVAQFRRAARVGPLVPLRRAPSWRP